MKRDLDAYKSCDACLTMRVTVTTSRLRCQKQSIEDEVSKRVSKGVSLEVFSSVLTAVLSLRDLQTIHQKDIRKTSFAKDISY